MSKPKILVLVGGISSGSINKKLFSEVKRLTSDKFDYDEVDITAIPYFSQDLETDLPPVVKDLKSRLASADGVLIITPEYNRSMPGVLKNAIDWGSRPYGSNNWKDKPAATMGSTPGSAGTICAQTNLRQVLTEIGACVMALPNFYHSASQGEWQLDEKTEERVKSMMDAFAVWIRKLNS